MALRLAGHTIEDGHALDCLRGYPETSVLFYDFAGDPEAGLRADDQITLADIGRMVAIDARLDGADVASLLDPALEPPWDGVPHDARLEDADPEIENGLYDAMDALYRTFMALDGIGPAKASKLLHVKRPLAFPVLDSLTLAFYAGPAAMAAQESPRFSATHESLYSQAIRMDLISAGTRLRALRDEASPHKPILARLPELRILDIIAWRLAGG